ncbi:hypothetical protein EXIGLDRAFT_155149 [Exidia glandulosa HHB12029]|uniref:Uncharacterized protein n=1 Tax=Exidia glandulosa HHB12029 TaxID=1314781 RepID=A0A166BSJ9_EXIGL|nr:hypothetical protein EXIGLDRAFT_155149 [Exidia glandulosa HHB12029]
MAVDVSGSRSMVSFGVSVSVWPASQCWMAVGVSSSRLMVSLVSCSVWTRRAQQFQLPRRVRFRFRSGQRKADSRSSGSKASTR